jgi:hypothetical protein
MIKAKRITKKDGTTYMKYGIPFKNGAPQVVFRKKNGSTFTKTYRSDRSAYQSTIAWRKNGGKIVKEKTFKRKRK